MEDFDWMDFIEEEIELDGLFSSPSKSLDDFWDEAYPLDRELDDGWDFLPESDKAPVEKFNKTLEVRAVPESAFTTVRYMTDYGRTLSEEMVNGFQVLYEAPSYQELNLTQRARILRYRLAPVVSKTYDKMGGVAVTAFTNVLRDRGIITKAPYPLAAPAFDRLKGIISKSLNLSAESEDPWAGWGTFEGGVRNIVEMAGREVMLQSSELVNNLTGMPLKGLRIIQAVDSCDFCKGMASKGFEISTDISNRDFLKFHDNCTCSVELL